MAKFKQGDIISIGGHQGAFTVKTWPDNDEGAFVAVQYRQDGGENWLTGWTGADQVSSFHAPDVVKAAEQGDVPSDHQKIGTNEVIPPAADINTPIPLATEPLVEDEDVPAHVILVDGEGQTFEKELTPGQRFDLANLPEKDKAGE